MGKRKKQVRERLRRAQEDMSLVRIYRGEDLDDIEGYVVAVGREWLLLAVLDPAIVLDGYAALRLADVRRVGRRRRGDMAQQALTLRKQWPPTPPSYEVDLRSATRLLRSLMAQQVIGVHAEHDDPDGFLVGTPVKLDDGSLRLLEVTPLGVWTRRPTRHPVDGITRVDVGGRYEEALMSVAGPAKKTR